MTSILKVDTIQDADGNNIINESGNTITIGASGDTTNIIGTLNKDGVAVANTPAFFAYLSSNQSCSDATFVKAQFDTEILDTANAYDNSTNYRFTPQVAGNYFILVNVMSNYSNTTCIQDAVIYKNGDKFLRSYVDNRGQNTYNQSTNVSGIVNLNGSSDYVEGYVRLDVGSGTPELSGSTTSPLQHYTYMFGYKIIE